MSFFSMLLLAGPLAVVLGVVLGHCISSHHRYRGTGFIRKLSESDIHNLLNGEIDIRMIRGALAELRRRGVSISFAKPRLVDLSTHANRMVSISAQEVLNDYYGDPSPDVTEQISA